MLIYIIWFTIGLYATMCLTVLAKLSVYGLLGKKTILWLLCSLIAPMVLLFKWVTLGQKKIDEITKGLKWNSRLLLRVKYVAFYFKHYPSIVEECVKVLTSNPHIKNATSAARKSTQDWSSSFA